jgi:hypothetical protein
LGDLSEAPGLGRFREEGSVGHDHSGGACFPGGSSQKTGFKQTKASIANKLARTTMSVHFFPASLVAIGRDAITLQDI